MINKVSKLLASQKLIAENPQKLPGIPLPNQLNTPAQPDENHDPTKPGPGGNEPEKNDPTHFIEPLPDQPELPIN
jgi:hypothetical protein